MKRFLPWTLIGCAVVVAGYAANWPSIRFAKLEAGDFVSRLGVLLLFALLIERTVEVFLTIWRAEESYKRQAAVQRLISDGKSAIDPELKRAQDQLIEYRTETQRWALPISFILGLLIASFGVRVIDQFVVPVDSQTQGAPSGNQLWWFHVTDIVLTAALLAGGADPIHKLMDAFRKFMEASSAKASGTVKT